MIWEEEELAILRKMAAEGASASEIGDALGASRNAVIGKCRRCGIKLPMSQEKWSRGAKKSHQSRWTAEGRAAHGTVMLAYWSSRKSQESIDAQAAENWTGKREEKEAGN